MVEKTVNGGIVVQQDQLHELMKYTLQIDQNKGTPGRPTVGRFRRRKDGWFVAEVTVSTCHVSAIIALATAHCLNDASIATALLAQAIDAILGRTVAGSHLKPLGTKFVQRNMRDEHTLVIAATETLCKEISNLRSGHPEFTVCTDYQILSQIFRSSADQKFN